MDVNRELDRIIAALDTGRYNRFIRCLLRRWKSLLEEFIA